MRTNGGQDRQSEDTTVHSDRLVDAAKSGNWAARAKPDVFEGAYAGLLRGINEMLDALIRPVGKAIRVIVPAAVELKPAQSQKTSQGEPAVRKYSKGARSIAAHAAEVIPFGEAEPMELGHF